MRSRSRPFLAEVTSTAESAAASGSQHSRSRVIQIIDHCRFRDDEGKSSSRTSGRSEMCQRRYRDGLSSLMRSMRILGRAIIPWAPVWAHRIWRWKQSSANLSQQSFPARSRMVDQLSARATSPFRRRAAIVSETRSAAAASALST